MDTNVNVSGYEATQVAFEDLEEQWGDSATWVVGSNVEYAVYLEMGTRDMPPYPWMRPAVRDVLNNQADDLADESDSTEEFVKKLAFAIERQAKQNVSADRSVDRSPGTDPEHPKRDTGTLVNSIRAEKVR